MRWKSVSMAMMLCLAAGVVIAQPEKVRLTLRTHKAKYAEADLQKIQAAVKQIPAEYYRLNLVKNGKKVASLGSAELKNLRVVHVYCPNPAGVRLNIDQGKFLAGADPDGPQLVFTSNLPEGVKARVANVERLLQARVQR